MKERCMCPKPKYQVNGKDLPEEWQRKLGTILHFKASDRNCERCGRGLCSDCVEGGNLADHNWYYSIWYIMPTLCAPCAEDVK